MPCSLHVFFSCRYWLQRGRTISVKIEWTERKDPMYKGMQSKGAPSRMNATQYTKVGSTLEMLSYRHVILF